MVAYWYVRGQALSVFASISKHTSIFLEMCESDLVDTLRATFPFVLVFFGAQHFPWLTGLVLGCYFLYPLVGKVLDAYLGVARTHLGTRLGPFGRLTYGTVWTDDPEISRMHDELDRTEGRRPHFHIEGPVEQLRLH